MIAMRMAMGLEGGRRAHGLVRLEYVCRVLGYVEGLRGRRVMVRSFVYGCGRGRDLLAA